MKTTRSPKEICKTALVILGTAAVAAAVFWIEITYLAL